jgi:immune inhibitor A
MDSLAGKKAQFRYRYKTDGGVAENGFFADDMKVTADGAEVLNDGAENGENGWALKGFKPTTGTETNEYDNFYLASNRTYESFDQYMKTGPYNFGFADSKPDWAEHFAYQDGLLVSYWDESQSDNSTSAHPGTALWMPIDANPAPVYDLEGKPWRPRVSGYDAPFGTQKSDSFTLHVNGKPSYIRGQGAKTTFDDTKQYWYEATPTAGVKLPAVGVGIKVLKQDGTSMTIQVFNTK